MIADKPEYKQTLKPENYLELWKYFTDDAAKIKDRMWTIASLFFAAVTALISFIANNLSRLPEQNIFKSNEFMLLIMTSIALLGLCFYFKYMITQYGTHIRNGWNRADFIRRRIDGLAEIWYLGNDERMEEAYKIPTETSLPNEAKRLIYFSNLIMVCYVLFVMILFVVFWPG